MAYFNFLHDDTEPVLTRTSARVAKTLATDPKLERIVAQLEVGVRYAEDGRDAPWQVIATGRKFHLCYWEVDHGSWSHVDYYIQSTSWSI